MASPSQAIGVKIFGILMIVGALYKLFGFLNFDYYRFMFQQLPPHLIYIRYIFSVIFRIMEVVTGIGLLSFKKIFRIIALGICILSLCTIYWKHPLFVFKNIAIYTEYKQNLNVLPSGTTFDRSAYPMYSLNANTHTLRYSSFPLVSLIFYSAIDIIFFSTMIFYFTRPKVIAQFH